MGVELVNYYRAMELMLLGYRELRGLLADKERYVCVEEARGRSGSIVLRGVDGGGGLPVRNDEELRGTLEELRLREYERTLVEFEVLDDVVRRARERREFPVVGMYYLGEDADGVELPLGVARLSWEEIADVLGARGLCRDAKTARRWRNGLVRDMSIWFFGSRAAVSAAGVYDGCFAGDGGLGGE